MKKVSVIVPIYNVEPYIEKCVRSIISQSYQNLEIILVDDGSKDNSSVICKSLSENDKRVLIIHQGNMGLSGARNTGIKAASGEYCMFVDGDDWLDLDCIEKTVKEIEKGYEAILFPYKKEYDSGSMTVKIFPGEKEFDEEEVKNKLLRRLFGPLHEELKRPTDMEQLSTAWGKLYRLEKIKKIKFVDTKKIGTEDTWFNINAFNRCKNVKYIDSVFYHYNKMNEHALTRTYKPYLAENWNTLYSMQVGFIKENRLGREFEEALLNRRVINLLSLVLNIGLSEISWKEKIRELKKILRDERYKIAFRRFPFRKLSVQWRLFYWLCYNEASRMILFSCIAFRNLSRMKGKK